jgi:hypothetical protein
MFACKCTRYSCTGAWKGDCADRFINSCAIGHLWSSWYDDVFLFGRWPFWFGRSIAHLLLCVAPRSGLAVKNFIDVGAGVIDSDYRGAVGVVLFNFSSTDFQGMLCSGNPYHTMFVLL